MFAFVLLAASFLVQGIFAQSYYSFWSEGGGNFRCTNGAGGSYTADWSGNGGFVCGKGWSPGGPRLVALSSEITPIVSPRVSASANEYVVQEPSRITGSTAPRDPAIWQCMAG